jgi:hypothetical protein
VTTIAVSPAPPEQFGVTTTLTATVKNASPADILPPVGTVTFMDSFTQGGITTNTTLGTVQLSSDLSVTSLTRSGTTATVTLSGPVTSTEYAIQGASPSGYNGTFAVTPTGVNTFTYTVPNTLTTPATGTISAFALGISSATAVFKTSTLAGGNPTAVGHTVTAIYNGDITAPFPLPTSFPFRGQWRTSQATGTFQVGADTTTGTLSATPASPQQIGTAITFIDRVTSGSGMTPHGGTVVFKDGATVLGTTSLNIRGQATLIVNLPPPVGAHSITAVYNGNGNFKADTSPALVYTASNQPTTTVASAPVPSATAGNNVTVKAVVSGVQGGPTPTGKVVFVEEANIRSALAGTAAAPLTLGTATLAGGVATLSVPTSLTTGLIPDLYEIEAFYQGDPNSGTSHSTTAGAGLGQVACAVSVFDTRAPFMQNNANPTSGTGAMFTISGRVLPQDNLANGAQAGVETGPIGGTLSVTVDGVSQTLTSPNGVIGPGFAPSGRYSLTVNVGAVGTHVIVVHYNGDALTDLTTYETANGYPQGAAPASAIGFIPASTTDMTLTYTRTSVAANALASPSTGSVLFSTAPKNSTGSSSTTTTTSTTKSSSSSGLSVASVDQVFASTTHSTPRTLAGALAKAQSGEDWLNGPF